MAYSTGSGTVTDLLAAVLAHAVADGWTTTGGTWPISKGILGWIHAGTSTRSSTSWFAGASNNFTETILRLGLGQTAAEATASFADETTPHCPNFHWPITEWHIYSDPGLGKPDYVHVVARFSNGVDPECFNHFSFGEIDKGGLTYGAVTYVATSCRRAYPAESPSSNNDGSSAQDWNCGPLANCPPYMGGFYGRTSTRSAYTSGSGLRAVISPVDSPVPLIGTWPTPGVRFTDNTILYTGGAILNMPTSFTNSMYSANRAIPFAGMSHLTRVHPYSGSLSMDAIPFALVNDTGTSTGARVMMLGTFPGIRYCNMDSYVPRDELVLGAETWQLMPLLKQTPYDQLLTRGLVTSGGSGLAYKKVL